MSGADIFLRSVYQDWPNEACDMYERLEVLGRGSFGIVWMARRLPQPVDRWDDEYVAIKNIEVPDNKGALYAEREIRILKELKHPNVIRFIREFPVHDQKSRLVVLQLARGVNLNQLVMTGGALGMPLARLLCRQLTAAVAYLHGRAVIHRDIKPGNCILENCHLKPHEENNDWVDDETIWSDGPECEEAVKSNKWKLMLIDFGFARALEPDEVFNQPRNMRNSIMAETKGPGNMKKEMSAAEIAAAVAADHDMSDSEESNSDDDEMNSEAIEKAAAAIGGAPSTVLEADDEDEDLTDVPENDELNGNKSRKENNNKKPRMSIKEEMDNYVDLKKPRPSITGNLEPLEPSEVKQVEKKFPSAVPPATKIGKRRSSTARTKMRSMSALGTKAYAAPEIKKKLRKKTAEDHGKSNAALTECVADYGMIVDAYSVGWTMRVILTGVPPNCTISQYVRKIQEEEEREAEKSKAAGSLFCCCSAPPVEKKKVRVRDAHDIPKDATVLITQLTKPDPEERITVREAQTHAWIAGGHHGEPMWEFPEGDVPSQHGDPVKPLDCAGDLSKLVEGYHDDR